MLFSVLSTAAMALSILAPTVAAVPTPGPQKGNTGLTKLAARMPKSALPAPDGLQLKFVGLGIGTQNYTCKPGNDTAEPGTTGAVAKLYDLGTRLNTDPLADWKISTISGLALNMYDYPAVLNGLLWSQGYQQVLGDHFFTITVPTFYLNKVNATPKPLAFVKKNLGVDAPKSACPGIKGEGAIQWLHLIDNGNSQGGVNTVYRLETAGGAKPKTCKGMPEHWEVPYAAQYWVYGPAA
ncbi:hypothetical protein BU24DRAFT_51818 [Aaosphaeria arxii CBS 175.79]|uniref:Malate dehydrogenase n=1 Tax=Aaosphaeria arxii CBS 175.79 TaxID=1450172 RepID=A0A6A5XDW0_9PLEO|nr:uncharacterized protein BU24DRAFT_51818 [Aaosphaeria arxii CBS 175.79]KAF2011041.1 hypothetical protein BU24DRAFT_51818 [Aaosphaeria arxii CBS 175.79]